MWCAWKFVYVLNFFNSMAASGFPNMSNKTSIASERHSRAFESPVWCVCSV